MWKQIWKRYGRTLVAVCGLLASPSAPAQQLAVKTNVLSDVVALVPSLAVERAVGLRWTAQGELAWQPLRLSATHFVRELKVQGEARFWWHAPFTGPFVGPSLGYRAYNLGGTPFFHTRDSRTQGWLLAVGAVGGYHFTLSDRWGLEPSVTLGYAYARYRRYQSPRERHVHRRALAHYAGPTALQLSVVYMLK